MTGRTGALAATLTTGLLAVVPAAHAATCKRFVVGQANSTAYADGKLPARGTTTKASCATLRGLARGIQSGAYPVPTDAVGQSLFGAPFTVRHQGRSWRCRYAAQGGSGPTYAVRCTRPGGVAASWTVG